MNFIVYSKNGCPYCDKVKMILEHLQEKNNWKYTIYTLNEDFNREEFYAEFGEASTFPQVICDDVHIGGCTDTVKYLQEKRMI
jgi:glutaredoxin